jgi:predicted lipoprotein with Yx(FWY)xxD motif
MRRVVTAAVAAAACGAAGCGEKSETVGSAPAPAGGTTTTETTTGATDKPARGVRVTITRSEYGRVVADSKGEALYLFDKEKSKKAECYGTCAKAWPPFLTKGKPQAGKGVREGLLGTTKRRNGRRQVTYRGHPLYYFVSDSPGTILCQDVFEYGGRWLVVQPSGRAVT